MTPDAFREWLVAMKTAGLARSDAECARLLERTPRHLLDYKKRGTDHVTALACRALYHRMQPWS